MRRIFLCALLCAAGAAQADVLNVGSKRFTESYILGEILIRTAADGAVHRQGLGNTGILYAALKSGAIDLYPEYTGTIAKEILKLEGNPGLAELNRALAPLGFGVAVPLGFNNSYALAMREERAQALGVRTLADLAKHPTLKLGLSQEFIGHADGPRSRPCLRGDRRRPDRRHGHLHHRCQDRAFPAARARGRSQILPAL